MMTILSLVIVSCEKTSSHDNYREEMAFQIIMPVEVSPSAMASSPQTKAEITNESITKFTLFGKEDNQSAFSPDASIVINKPAGGTIWKPDIKYYWKDDPRYTFHGYAHTPVPSNASLTLSEEGRTLNITQPNTYDIVDGKSSTIDYLLSYQISYEPSKTHQVVPIMLEHALAKVSLYVTRATAMNNLNIHDVKITFDKIKNQATMFCSKQKDYNKAYETHNEWSYNIGTSVAKYELNFTDGSIIKDENNTKSPVMSFIAIPNDHEGMKDYSVTLSYKVTIDNNTLSYSRTFNLYDVTQMWESGHHIIYNFLIDNGIHLTGSIVDWVNVDYIEGTILPPIAGNDDNKNEGGKNQ